MSLKSSAVCPFFNFKLLLLQPKIPTTLPAHSTIAPEVLQSLCVSYITVGTISSALALSLRSSGIIPSVILVYAWGAITFTFIFLDSPSIAKVFVNGNRAPLAIA